MDDFDRGAMLDTFIHEMGTLVDQLENTMIQTGEVYSVETINEIFRIMHTIKGSASMMLFTALAEVTHSAEDLFFFLREHKDANADYPLITDFVLEVVDFIKLQLYNLEHNEDLDESPKDLMTRIDTCLKGLKGDKASAGTKAPEVPIIPVIEEGESGSKKYSVRVFFQEGSEMENVRAFTIVHNLKDVATDIITVPENVLDEDAVWVIRDEGFAMTLSSNLSAEQLEEVLRKSIYVREMSIVELDSQASKDEVYSNTFDVLVKFQREAEMENVRAYALVHNLQDKARILKQNPADLFDEMNAAVIKANGLRLLIDTNLTYDELNDILQETIYLEEVGILEIEKQAKEEPVAKEAEQPTVVASVPSSEPEAVKEHPAANSEISQDDKDVAALKEAALKDKGDITIKKTTTHSISVNVAKLDQLLNLVGELVISEAMVTQNPELEGVELDSFTKESRQLRKIITDIQYTVMSMRMVPLTPTFFKMHRIVRDMCRQLKKDVDLEIIGDDTEVDKNIIEHISDPLMHIIRNSVDHGIEMPDIRIRSGKREKGTVTLEAKNSGGDVLIIIKDDGAGFNKEKILEKARHQGLLVKPEEEYTDKEIYQFIFVPGFSTNEQVTSFSGRGVGMDVVNTNLDHVGGTVIADSAEGEGSSITLKIPLTLAIIDGMLIKIGDAKYTIPIMDIRRSLKVTHKDIVFDPNNNEMVKIRGEIYNLVRLNRFFGLDIGYDDVEDGIVLMLENGDQTVCVFADELVGEQQIVVKNIPKYIKKVTGLSGCTLLGNGDISLIINVASFFDR